MTPEFAIQAIRDSLLMTFTLAAPILLAGLVAGVRA
jgi:flagellar biosynthesis protein FliQ